MHQVLDDCIFSFGFKDYNNDVNIALFSCFHALFCCIDFSPGWISPTDDQAGHTFTVRRSSLDESGVFWLRNEKQIQAFVASRILVKRLSGPLVLNFDFVGTFYDFETARDNKHVDNREDDWNNVDISEYWIKGDDTLFMPS